MIKIKIFFLQNYLQPTEQRTTVIKRQIRCNSLSKNAYYIFLQNKKKKKTIILARAMTLRGLQTMYFYTPVSHLPAVITSVILSEENQIGHLNTLECVTNYTDLEPLDLNTAAVAFIQRYGNVEKSMQHPMEIVQQHKIVRKSYRDSLRLL